MTLLNTLGWTQWLLLGLIPPLIVLLYFLKLKRRPIEVPSTYLWSRTVEDLNVNTIWQRLRRNLLLLLQLLVILLIILTCLRPGWRGTKLDGERFIFVLDNSASMSATDVGPSRLESAKKTCLEFIRQLEANQSAMLISCNDRAQVEVSYGNDRGILTARTKAIRATSRRSDLTQALRYAEGLANPAQSRESIDDARPATLYVFSDGGVTPVNDFKPGYLTLKYLPIGEATANNVAITSFSAVRNTDKPGKLDVFARVENFGLQPAAVTIHLQRDGGDVGVTPLTIDPQGSSGADFEIPDFDAGVLKLVIEESDDLPADNVAYNVVNQPRKARVLLVTPGNPAFKLATGTSEALRVADVQISDPSVLATQPHQDEAAAGSYDLIIYDQCAPEKLPRANTLFIGQLPPGDQWKKNDNTGPPLIIDADQMHPLMQLVSTSQIAAYKGFGLQLPKNGSSLIDSNLGPLFAIAPRGGFEDAVLGFSIVQRNEDGSNDWITDWPLRRSFPVFVMNCLRYLGGGSAGRGHSVSVRPGEPVTIRTTDTVETIQVVAPSGQRFTVGINSRQAFTFNATNEIGVYQVYAENSNQVDQRFAVNLFDIQESDIAPKEKIVLSDVEQVEASSRISESRQELWRWLLLVGFCVLLIEWYVYNRRVYA